MVSQTGYYDVNEYTKEEAETRAANKTHASILRRRQQLTNPTPEDRILNALMIPDDRRQFVRRVMSNYGFNKMQLESIVSDIENGTLSQQTSLLVEDIASQLSGVADQERRAAKELAAFANKLLVLALPPTGTVMETAKRRTASSCLSVSVRMRRWCRQARPRSSSPCRRCHIRQC